MRLPTLFKPRPTRCACAVVGVLLAALAAGCVEPPPRSFHEFMDDRIAREGVLARCGRDGEPRDDVECANARRAAATIALRKERERRKELARESERKIEALREQVERREAAAREAEAAARRAYDEQWESGAAGTVVTPDPDKAAAAADAEAPGDGLAPIAPPTHRRIAVGE